MKYLLSLVLSLSILLIPCTSSAAVIDPKENDELYDLLEGTPWIDWLLIEQSTLQDMLVDAKVGIKLSGELERMNDTITLLMHRTQTDAETIRELQNPPWYKNPQTLSAAGVVFGIVFGVFAMGIAGSR